MARHPNWGRFINGKQDFFFPKKKKRFEAGYLLFQVLWTVFFFSPKFFGWIAFFFQPFGGPRGRKKGGERVEIKGGGKGGETKGGKKKNLGPFLPKKKGILGDPKKQKKKERVAGGGKKNQNFIFFVYGGKLFFSGGQRFFFFFS